MAGFSLTGARKDDGGWGTRERPFPSVRKQRLCRALRSHPRHSGARRRSALAVSGSLCAPVRESSGAPRCSRQSLGVPATGQGRRSAGARARVVPARRPCQPRPKRRGGAEGARPAGTAVEGDARPRTSAPERSRHKSAPPAPAIQWPSSPSGAPLPCNPAPARICTHIWAARDGGPPGSRSSAPGSESVPRASSQPRLGGPLSLANNSDLRRVACRPPKTKGKRG